MERSGRGHGALWTRSCSTLFLTLMERSGVLWRRSWSSLEPLWNCSWSTLEALMEWSVGGAHGALLEALVERSGRARGSLWRRSWIALEVLVECSGGAHGLL